MASIKCLKCQKDSHSILHGMIVKSDFVSVCTAEFHDKQRDL